MFSDCWVWLLIHSQSILEFIEFSALICTIISCFPTNTVEGEDSFTTSHLAELWSGANCCAPVCVVSCRFCHNKSTIQLMMAFYGCLKCRSVPSADNGCHHQTCHYPNKQLNKHSIPPDYLSFPLDGAPLWRTGKKQHTRPKPNQPTGRTTTRWCFSYCDNQFPPSRSHRTFGLVSSSLSI